MKKNLSQNFLEKEHSNLKRNYNFELMSVEEIKELIKRRRFQILVHSFIYYRLDNNIISNETFNLWALELIELQNKYPEISKEVELYEEFRNFTNVGDAAFLPLDNDERLKNRAMQLLNQHLGDS